MSVLIVVFAISTIYALRQPPWPHPFKPMTLAQWFFHPYERNAFRRLPAVVVEQLNAVVPVPGTNTVFVVGSGGMIAELSDNGRCLRQRSFPGGPVIRGVECPSEWSIVSDAEAVEVRDQPQQEEFKNSKQGVPSIPKEDAGAPAVPTRHVRNVPGGSLPLANPESTRAIDVKRDALRTPDSAPTPGFDAKQVATKPTEGKPALQSQVRAGGTATGVAAAVPSTRPTPEIEESARRLQPELFGGVFVDQAHGWVVGAGGTILATDDGGATWQLRDSGTTADLHAIAMSGARGSIVGNAILSTDDGGGTWKVVVREDGSGWTSVSFGDPEHGWAVGYGIVATADGGQTWQPQQTSAVRGRLNAVHFVDGQQGWAVGMSGTILATADGGRHWESQASGIAVDLFGVSFRDRSVGIAVGDGGAVLFTADGGRNWTRKSVADEPADLRGASVAIGDVWAVGESGTVLHADTIGSDLVAATMGTHAVQFAAFQVNERDAWIAGSRGMLLHSTDGGSTWVPVPTGTTDEIRTMYFTDAERGWLAGSRGTVLATTDGGRTWSPQATGASGDVTSIRFQDRSRGTLFVGLNAYGTTDGGKQWAPQDPPGPVRQRNVAIFGDGRGWAVYGPFLTATTDFGAKWVDPKAVDFEEPLQSLRFLDDHHGWAVGENGRIVRTSDGGRSWSATRIEADLLLGVDFVDEHHGWTTGTSVAARSDDGGATWATRPIPGTIGLDVHFVDADNGLIAGAGAAPLVTHDGGATWHAPVHSRLPAPWYWVLSATLLGIGYVVFHRAGVPEDVPERVGDLLISDRPLTAGDPDALGVADIANALARFLSNRSTQPPLTIAVTGPWGTGKSSLMNLLYEDLQRRRFSPVWFNAWHHQKGEQLLASLFAHIKKQAVPPWFSRAGIGFRARLFHRRALKQKLAFALLTVIAAVTLPLLFAQITKLAGAVADFRHGVPLHPETWMASLRAVVVPPATGTGADGLDTLLALMGGIPSLALVLRTVRGFGIDPGQLVAIGGAESGKTPKLDPGARARFAEEFDDVAASLDLGSMVIFIDDLDRCAPENVLEILETVNFLSVSGRCFIVMSMARDWVETCVGLGFKDVDDAWQAGRRATGEVAGGDGRRDFARQYLKKLINLDIPVPYVTPDGLQRLLVPPPAVLPSRWESLVRYAHGYGVAVAVVGLVSLAWFCWSRFPDTTPQKVPSEDLAILSSDWSIQEAPEGPDTARLVTGLGKNGRTAASSVDAEARRLALVLRGSPKRLESRDGIVIGKIGDGEEGAQLVVRYAPTPIASPTLETTGAVIASPTVAPRANAVEPAEVVNGDRNHSTWLAAGSTVLLWLLLTGLAAAASFRRPVRFTRDSQSFRDALTIWAPWVYVASTTPRETKRFLNRVRYVAMRCTKEAVPTSVLEGWWSRARRAPAENAPLAASAPESVLVALAAIHNAAKTLVEDVAKFERLGHADVDALMHGGVLREELPFATPEDLSALAKAIAEHAAGFQGQWPPTPEARTLFLAAVSEARS